MQLLGILSVVPVSLFVIRSQPSEYSAILYNEPTQFGAKPNREAMINSAISTAQTGLQQGVKRAEDAAHAIASASNVENNESSLHKLTESGVELKLAETQVVAAAVNISSVNEALGALVDTFQ